MKFWSLTVFASLTGAIFSVYAEESQGPDHSLQVKVDKLIDYNLAPPPQGSRYHFQLQIGKLQDSGEGRRFHAGDYLVAEGGAPAACQLSCRVKGVAHYSQARDEEWKNDDARFDLDLRSLKDCQDRAADISAKAERGYGLYWLGLPQKGEGDSGKSYFKGSADCKVSSFVEGRKTSDILKNLYQPNTFLNANEISCYRQQLEELKKFSQGNGKKLRQAYPHKRVDFWANLKTANPKNPPKNSQRGLSFEKDGVVVATATMDSDGTCKPVTAEEMDQTLVAAFNRCEGDIQKREAIHSELEKCRLLFKPVDKNI